MKREAMFRIEVTDADTGERLMLAIVEARRESPGKYEMAIELVSQQLLECMSHHLDYGIEESIH